MANPIFSTSTYFNASKNAPVATLPRPAGNAAPPAGGTSPQGTTAPYPPAPGTAVPPTSVPPTAAFGPDHLQQWYEAPPAGPQQTGRLTYEDVIVKTGAMLAIVVLAAAATWMLAPMLYVPAMLVGLVLGLVNSFKKRPSPVLIVLYAVAEGMFVGGLSAVLEMAYPGVAIQAVLATVSTFAVMLVLFRSGKVRVRGKFAKVMIGALAGYFVYSMVNLVLQFSGVLPGWGINSLEIGGFKLGILIGLVGVFLGAMCLVMDFDAIQTAVERGAPRESSWFAAFGLTASLIWLYVEFLRLLSILRD